MEFRNSRLKSTILVPFQNICILPESVTFATSTALMFSLSQKWINWSLSLASTTTAIRSCDSEIASSVPFSPSYFKGKISKSISKESAISPIATETPPAPKSLDFFIKVVTSGLRKSLWIFLSSTAFPFWTSVESVCIEVSSCSLEEPVAPPTPSRPVAPPSKITMSPFCGFSRFTQVLGTAPTTKPTSILFAL